MAEKKKSNQKTSKQSVSDPIFIEPGDRYGISVPPMPKDVYDPSTIPTDMENQGDWEASLTPDQKLALGLGGSAAGLGLLQQGIQAANNGQIVHPNLGNLSPGAGFGSFMNNADQGIKTTVGNLTNPSVMYPLWVAARSAQKLYDDATVNQAIQNPTPKTITAASKQAGSTIGDVATGENLPKQATDYVVKPAIEGLTAAGKTALGKAGDVASGVLDTELGKTLKTILGAAMPTVRSAAGSMGLGEAWNAASDLLGNVDTALNPTAPTTEEKPSVATPKVANIEKPTDEEYKNIIRPAMVSSKGEQWVKDAKKKDVVSEYKKSITEPIAVGKETVTTPAETKPSMLKSLYTGMGKVDEKDIEAFNKRYPKEYYNTMMPRYFRPELAWEKQAEAQKDELAKAREARLSGQKDNEYLRIYLKKSQDNMEQLKLFDEVSEILKNPSPLAAAQLRYKLARIANGGGVLTQQDVDQSYAPGGPLYQLGEKLKKFFANPSSNPLPSATRATIFDFARTKVQADIDNQFKNRQTFGAYLDSKGVDPSVKQSILLNDNLGSFNDQASWTANYWLPKVKAIQDELAKINKGSGGGGGAGTGDLTTAPSL